MIGSAPHSLGPSDLGSAAYPSTDLHPTFEGVTLTVSPVGTRTLEDRFVPYVYGRSKPQLRPIV